MNHYFIFAEVDERRVTAGSNDGYPTQKEATVEAERLFADASRFGNLYYVVEVSDLKSLSGLRGEFNGRSVPHPVRLETK